MSSGGVVDRDAITAAFDAVDAALDGVARLGFDALTTPECLGLLERSERWRRRLPAPEHKLINHVARQSTPEELGGKLSHAIAERMLISKAEAARRINEAADLGPRRGLTGEPLEPVLANAAAAQRGGELGAGQVAVIRRFSTSCPAGSTTPPASKSKPSWPNRAPSFAPNNSPHWPTHWPTASTPTAPTPTTTVPGAAA